MRQFIHTLCIILFSLVTFTQSHASTMKIEDAIITDPSISRRCSALIHNRKQRVKHRQRLTFLSLRNQKLQKATPENKKSILDRLKTNHTNIENELKLTNLKIQNLEESIIRKGCPGLIL